MLNWIRGWNYEDRVVTAADLVRAIAEIERDRPQLLRWVRAQGVESSEDAEDLLQRALRVLWQRASEAGIATDAARCHRAYLFGILRNEVRNHRRFQRRHPAPDPLPTSGAVEPTAAQVSEFATWFALQIELGALCRRVLAADDLRLLELHYFEGCSVAEIAVLYDSTRGAVKMRMHRIRQRILAALMSTDQGPPPTGPRGRARRVPTSSEGSLGASLAQDLGECREPRSESEVDAWLREYAALCRNTGLRMFDHEPLLDSVDRSSSRFPARAHLSPGDGRTGPGIHPPPVVADPPSLHCAALSRSGRSRPRRTRVRIPFLAAAAVFVGLLFIGWNGVDESMRVGRLGGSPPTRTAVLERTGVSASPAAPEFGGGTRRSSTSVLAIERSTARLEQWALPDDPPRFAGLRLPGEWNSWCTEWWYPRAC